MKFLTSLSIIFILTGCESHQPVQDPNEIPVMLETPDQGKEICKDPPEGASRIK